MEQEREGAGIWCCSFSVLSKGPFPSGEWEVEGEKTPIFHCTGFVWWGFGVIMHKLECKCNISEVVEKNWRTEEKREKLKIILVAYTLLQQCPATCTTANGKGGNSPPVQENPETGTSAGPSLCLWDQDLQGKWSHDLQVLEFETRNIFRLCSKTSKSHSL